MSNIVYRNGDHYVRKEGDKFVTCDQEDCSKELEHIGDDYDTLTEAKIMVDFWAGGGHWSDRPDMKEKK